jgi:hypothetical protein
MTPFNLLTYAPYQIKKREADHGEVFTPDWMVEHILDLVKRIS